MCDTMVISEITQDEYRLLKNKIGIVTPEDIEEAYGIYHSGILDVFDHCLSAEETDTLLSSFIEHNLKYEDRFINFFNLAYEINDQKQVYMYFNLKGLEEYEILNILDTLDYQDKLIFIKQITKSKGNKHYFKIENRNVLKVFVKLATRELFFPVFYFTRVPLIVVGNYDLSFPLFCKKSDDLILYNDIVEKVGLHIRELMNE